MPDQKPKFLLREGKDYNPTKEKYEMFITCIAEGMAYCNVYDEDGNRSLMDVPVSDLEKVCDGDVKAGLIFNVHVKNQGEEISFSQLKRTPMSKQEFDKLYQYYEKEYGDL
ncbi:hypothetical protein GOV14_03210 [Candidatus Pacearchaeota archaeon]|nr:hypothetical protein [Candidatus Pacearchaeota archaeon]